MIVVDASVMVAFLADVDELGLLHAQRLQNNLSLTPLSCPSRSPTPCVAWSPAEQQMPTSRDMASIALPLRRDLESVFADVADRIWELRGQVTVYDVVYVAVAELLDVPLLTLDDRLRRAKGPRCSFLDL